MPQDIVKNNRTISQQLRRLAAGVMPSEADSLTNQGKQRDQLKPLSSQGTCVCYKRLHSLTLHAVRNRFH